MYFGFNSPYFKEWFFRQLPVFFKQTDTNKDVSNKGLLERYLEIFGDELDEGVIPFIETYLNQVDPTRADFKFGPHIAYTLGNPPNLLGVDARWFKVLQYIVDCYKIKGTKKSYELWFGLWSLNAHLIQYQPEEVRYDDWQVGHTYDNGHIYDNGCPTCSYYEIFVTTFEQTCEGGQISVPLTPELQALLEQLILLNEPINALLKGIIEGISLCDNVQYCIQEDVIIEITGSGNYDNGLLYDDPNVYDLGALVDIGISSQDCTTLNGDLDFGLLHCNDADYLVFVNSFGDLTYKSYYYKYWYSNDDGLTWLPFGGNSYVQLVSNLPNWGLIAFKFKILIFANLLSLIPLFIYYWNAALIWTFGRFIKYQLNGDGIWRELKRATQGTNYFCDTDSIEFNQPNPDYDTLVVGPDGPSGWSGNNVTKLGTELANGDYDATYLNLVGDLTNDCGGSKSFEIEVIPIPVIIGDPSICFGDTQELTLALSYDHYLWSTAETTASITVGTAGTYWVEAWNDGFNFCKRSADLVIIVKPELPVLEIINTPDACHPDFLSIVIPDVFDLYVTAGFDTYDFGMGPQVDNWITVNGGGIYDCTATIDGCSVTLPITIVPIENNTDYNIENLTGCRYTLHITQAEVIQANVVGDLYGDATGFISSFSNVLDIDFEVIGPDTYVIIYLTCVPGTDGCVYSLLTSQVCP